MINIRPYFEKRFQSGVFLFAEEKDFLPHQNYCKHLFQDFYIKLVKWYDRVTIRSNQRSCYFMFKLVNVEIVTTWEVCAK